MKRFEVEGALSGTVIARGVQYPDGSASVNVDYLGALPTTSASGFRDFITLVERDGYKVRWMD